jgi:hypothetical protein
LDTSTHGCKEVNSIHGVSWDNAMSDQPEPTKKPVPGQAVDAKPHISLDKSKKTDVQALAQASWQQELDKLSLPGGVKLTVAHAQPPEAHAPLRPADASGTAVPPKPPAAKPETVVAAKPPEAPSEGTFMSAVHWVTSIPTKLDAVCKENHLNVNSNPVAHTGGATDLTLGGIGFQSADIIKNRDMYSAKVMVGLLIATPLIAKVGGEGIERLGLKRLARGAEEGSGGLEKEILGAERASGRTIAGVASKEVDAGILSFNAQLEAARGSAAFEFGTGASTEVTGLRPIRPNLARSTSVPILDGTGRVPQFGRPITAEPGANVVRFQGADPKISRIPKGLGEPTIEPPRIQGLETHTPVGGLPRIEGQPISAKVPLVEGAPHEVPRAHLPADGAPVVGPKLKVPPVEVAPPVEPIRIRTEVPVEPRVRTEVAHDPGTPVGVGKPLKLADQTPVKVVPASEKLPAGHTTSDPLTEKLPGERLPVGHPDVVVKTTVHPAADNPLIVRTEGKPALTTEVTPHEDPLARVRTQGQPPLVHEGPGARIN